MEQLRRHHPNLHPADYDAIVVGGGIAGLYAAYRLEQAGFSSLVLEADAQTGGRVKSRPEKFTQLGLTLDDGANLINSTDTLALRLMNQFGIRYVRRLKAGMDGMNYLVDGVLYDQAGFDMLVYAESEAAISAIFADQTIWQAAATRDTDPKFIDESISHYLKRLNAGPILKKMLRSFFWSEYGYEISDLNLHVLFDYLQIDLSCPCFQLIPNVDEAYTVPGGTNQITANLAAKLAGQYYTRCPVKRIVEENGLVLVEVQSPLGPIIWRARHIFFAAPLHSLAKMHISVDGISQHSLDEAGISSYASGAKLHLKFQPGFDALYKYSGIVLTDTGEQIWPSGTGQGGAGLLTVLTGPLPTGRAAAVEHTGKILFALDQVVPGLSELYVAMERTDAPMSYSGSLRPGEWAHLAIHQGAKRWTTIGEASGGPLQGYLEGALRSADEGVTRYILSRRSAVKMTKP